MRPLIDHRLKGRGFWDSRPFSCIVDYCANFRASQNKAMTPPTVATPMIK